MELMGLPKMSFKHMKRGYARENKMITCKLNREACDSPFKE
jgi:hypothetical protein